MAALLSTCVFSASNGLFCARCCRCPTHNFTSFVVGARRIVLRSHSRFSHLFGARCVFDAWPCASVLNLRQQLVRVYLDMYIRKENFAHHIMKLQEELLRLTYSQDMQTHTHRHTHAHTYTPTHTYIHTHTYTCTHIHRYTRTCTYTHMHTHTHERTNTCTHPMDCPAELK